jgi:D-alanyl-D-alanine carboxypeptidase
VPAVARAGTSRWRVILAGFLLLAGAACSQDAGSGILAPTDGDAAASFAPVPDPSVDQLQTLLDRWTAEGKGGAALAIAHDGSQIAVLTSGVADPDGTPVDPADGFRIASITKTVVATIVLQLVDEGALDLDDEVSRFVEHPSIPTGATVRDLLGHTSGIYDVARRAVRSELRREPERRWRPEEVLDALASRHPAGTGFRYSNSNYVVAGLVVEAVSGRPLEEELNRRVVEPLELTGTYLPPMPGRDPIAGFTMLRPHGVTTSTPATAWETSTWAAGALVSTAEDLAVFFRALTGGELLSPAAFATMIEGFEDGATTGLGVFAAELGGGNGIIHEGAIDGFRSTAVATVTGDDLLVLLVNADRELPPLLDEIVESVFGVRSGDPPAAG